ncbi:Protein CBG26547 [Caenorhabditis briggsae]|nr:Protein CBG26547 [Caenorhabditis briggsae]CAS01097.1 Protein CBG26547 [Caenorhabditis briggsae]
MSKTYCYTRLTTHSNGGVPPKSPPEEPPIYSPVYSSVFHTPLRNSSSTINTAGSASDRFSKIPTSLSSALQYGGNSHHHGGHGDER